MSSLAHTDATAGSAGDVATGTYAVGLVFFISGMPALVYQLIWQRSLFTMFGINVEAVTVVVAGFLLGLGFGSLAGGYLSRRSSANLLALFGVIELAIGVFGLFSLHIVAAVGQRTLLLPVEQLTAVTLALLFVPTLFMGSTLPILSAYLVRRSRNVGPSIGLLYCVNTAGSATACFACVFFLMSAAGMQGAVTVAGSVNLLVGGLALAEAWRTRGRFARWVAAPEKAAVFARRTRRATHELVFAIVLAGLVGYIALSYEIAWFRAFMLADDSTPGFALVLGTYLAGIANGSLRVRRLFDDRFTQGDAAYAVAAALLLASVLGFLLLPAAALGATTPLGSFVPMLVMIFIQTSISGAIFPILCHYGITPDDRAGSHLSWIYVANILGSVAGTLVTGFVLMNALSIASISALLGALGAGVAIMVAAFGGMRWPRRLAVGAIGLIAATAMPLGSGGLFSGFYEHLLANNVVNPGAKFVETVENRNGVINVDSDLYAYGGVYDGRIAIDLMHDQNGLIRPFALSLFHPDPEEVLMIGLATGAWEQVIASHPQVKHVTIVEINRGYLEIIRKYAVVASLLDNPKVDIVIDDGRRWLNRHPERKFDVIVQNTTWYYRPNATNLLSREYLVLTAAHLREGGVIMYNTTGSLRVQRTGCTMFPGTRVSNAMVVSPTPMTLDPARLRQTLTDYRINGRPALDPADPLQQARLDEIVAALAPPPAGEPRPDALTEDCGGILARSAGLPLITDDNMGEEWTALVVHDPLLRALRGGS